MTCDIDLAYSKPIEDMMREERDYHRQNYQYTFRGHEQTLIACGDGKKIRVDTKMVPIIEMLNRKSTITTMCCEGNGRPIANKNPHCNNMAWIEFNGDDFVALMKRVAAYHFAKYGARSDKRSFESFVRSDRLYNTATNDFEPLCRTRMWFGGNSEVKFHVFLDINPNYLDEMTTTLKDFVDYEEKIACTRRKVKQND